LSGPTNASDLGQLNSFVPIRGAGQTSLNSISDRCKNVGGVRAADCLFADRAAAIYDVSMSEFISLSKAVSEGRLEDFIRQQEVAGTGPADEAAFLSAASKIIKHGQQLGQTSHSALPDGSTGK
jgi:hypothetical protein